jgi:hypothetical protein
MRAAPTRDPVRPPSRSLRVAGASLLALVLLAGAWLLPERSDLTGDVPGIEAGDSLPEASPAGPMSTGPSPVAPTRDQAEALEREAIASHLRRVEEALRKAPTDHLDEDRRAARIALLDELRAYREAGAFPRNLAAPGRVPVFVDDRGIHCAVGYLLHRTGADEIVQSIRESRNLALLPDLLDEPGLAGWLDAHGLEAGEAAWIQPMYCNIQHDGVSSSWIGCPPWPVNEPKAELSGGYLAASIGTSWIGSTLATVNLLDLRAERPSTGRALVGMAAGAAGMGLGAAGILEGGDARTVGWINLAVGTLGATSAAWTYRRASSTPTVIAEAPTRPIVIRPWVSDPAGEEGSRGAGLQVRIGR